MKQVNESDLLSRLASRAKKKLNKITEDEEFSKEKILKAVYEFKKCELSEAEKQLQKKIVQLKENNPDCDNPIGRLIDHKIYDNLSEERKQAYILKLSNDYQYICEKLNL